MRHAHPAGIGMTSQRTRDRLIERLQEEGITNRRVLEVMRVTPRHLFVEEAFATRAYEDTALPIGFGQTISQPYIVARMTEALLEGIEPSKVLEVGTGSGYQAAILAQLVPMVYTVERIPELYEQTRKRMHQLGYRNLRMTRSDGSWGWPEQAPFEAIMVTAAPEDVPESLLEQLAEGGRMLIPHGKINGMQKLSLIIRTSATHYERETIETVSFVPLIQEQFR